MKSITVCTIILIPLFFCSFQSLNGGAGYLIMPKGDTLIYTKNYSGSFVKAQPLAFKSNGTLREIEPVNLFDYKFQNDSLNNHFELKIYPARNEPWYNTILKDSTVKIRYNYEFNSMDSLITNYRVMLILKEGKWINIQSLSKKIYSKGNSYSLYFEMLYDGDINTPVPPYLSTILLDVAYSLKSKSEY